MGIPSKIMVNCLVCRSQGTGFLGIEKRKPDGDGTPRNKKNVVLQELARKKKSSSPLALEVAKLKKTMQRMEAVNSNQHRFYFDVVAKKSGNVIASDVPSYKVACRYIRQYALKTGDSDERYDIMLYRRKNHRRWSVLQCGTRFRDDQVLIVNAHYIEGRSAMSA